MKKILIAFNVFISVFIIVNLIFVYSFFMVKKDYKNKNVNITKGKSFQQIYKELGLNYEMIDKIYLKITGNSSNLKIGTYRFNGKYSRYEIVRKIQNKESNGVKLTIPEGFTKKQVYERINALGLGTEAEIDAALKEINFPYPHENNNFEGYFYPETYIFPEGVTTKQVIKTVLSEFLKKFPPEKYPDKNKFYDQLKLASIVEAEVSDAADKPKVAGVFIKRLKIDMKLESDATLKYELGRQALKGELKSKESPYNSYKVKGLPPTPIGNPPFDTFQAVEKAEVTDNLFFFTYKGKTYYSKTHDEHIQKRKETGQLK